MATARSKSKSSRKPPWKRAAPKGSAHHSLSPRKKSAAKARAKRAGRPYPNLVDNMRAAAPKKRAKAKRKKS